MVGKYIHTNLHQDLPYIVVVRVLVKQPNTKNADKRTVSDGSHILSTLLKVLHRFKIFIETKWYISH